MIIGEIPAATLVVTQRIGSCHNCGKTDCGEPTCTKCGIAFTHIYFSLNIIEPADRLRPYEVAA